MASTSGVKVQAHLYDLSQGMARQMSPMILGKQIEGIWHTGVVVFGLEYYYGGGICVSPPPAVPGMPYQTIDLGFTHKTRDQLNAYLQSIWNRYTTETYSLLNNNCNNFADDIAKFLLDGQGLPSYIVDLPNEALSSPMGAMLRPMIENMEAQMRQSINPTNIGGLNPLQNHTSNLPNAPAAPQLAQSTGNSSTSSSKPAPSVPAKAESEAPAKLDFTPHRLPKDTRMLKLAVAKLSKLGISNVDSITHAVTEGAISDESTATMNVILDTTAQYEPRSFSNYVLAVGALVRNWLTIPGAEKASNLAPWLKKSADAFEDMDNAVRAMLLTAVMNISDATNRLDAELASIAQHAVSWAINGDSVPISARKLCYEFAANTLHSLKADTPMEGSEVLSDLTLSLYGDILSDSDNSCTSARLEAARIGLEWLPHLREFLKDLSIDFLDLDDDAVGRLDKTSQEHVKVIRFYMCV
ncbi:hypothetical protein FOZ60_006699 [Perkinsus olseni]|uniref:PPPDE domain-containing protein n=3 Tax=Perkinsus olseni TaxID=32597 RepID=A0A7J6PFD7_PEROL|nr:hypothetical protein FOZ60_006699 [Perkinsus olseni]